jgi:hypothetical protein
MAIFGWLTPKQAVLYTRGTPKEISRHEFPTFTLQIVRWEKSMSFSE